MKQRAKIALGLLAVFLFLYGRLLVEARHELRQAEEFKRKGDTEEAIIHYDRAIHRYAPLNPYVGASLQSLWEVAQHEEEHDKVLALFAYDSMRGSLRSIRSIVQPYKDWIPKVDSKIATLRTKQQLELHPKQNPDEVLKFHQEALKRDDRANLKWAALLEFGFLGWISATIAWIWRGFTPEGKMRMKPSLPWMAAMVIFFSFWVIGLLKA